MANILFPTSVLGMMVLPLMIFHGIQLMVCAGLARRYDAGEKLHTGAAGKPRRESKTAGVSGAAPDASAPRFSNQRRDLHQLPGYPPETDLYGQTTAEILFRKVDQSTSGIAERHHGVSISTFAALFPSQAAPTKRIFSASSITVIPSCALAGLEPAASPAITRSVFFDTLPATFAQRH